MTDDNIIEAMARLDGLTPLEENEYYATCEAARGLYENAARQLMRPPDYLANHNAVQNVIDNLPDEVADSYFECLTKITSGSGIWSAYKENAAFVKATCRQKCEAILRVFRVGM